MPNTHDPYALHAEIADLSRRLGVIEAMLIGGATKPAYEHLVSLYWDAAAILDFTEVAARHWERSIFRVDARSMVFLARAIRDPTPWHPLLTVVDRYIQEGFDLEVCRQHLLGVAQDTLSLQGMSKIHPRDVAGNPIRIRAALAAIRRRGDLHGRKIV